MSAETMDNDVEPEKEDEQENNANLTGVRAPLASEEDLTAPGVTSFILYFTVKTDVYQNLIKLIFSLI